MVALRLGLCATNHPSQFSIKGRICVTEKRPVAANLSATKQQIMKRARAAIMLSGWVVAAVYFLLNDNSTNRTVEDHAQNFAVNQSVALQKVVRSNVYIDNRNQVVRTLTSVVQSTEPTVLSRIREDEEREGQLTREGRELAASLMLTPEALSESFRSIRQAGVEARNTKAALNEILVQLNSVTNAIDLLEVSASANRVQINAARVQVQSGTLTQAERLLDLPP